MILQDQIEFSKNSIVYINFIKVILEKLQKFINLKHDITNYEDQISN